MVLIVNEVYTALSFRNTDLRNRGTREHQTSDRSIALLRRKKGFPVRTRGEEGVVARESVLLCRERSLFRDF